MNPAEKIDYLNPDVPMELPWVDVPLVKATNESLKGYGKLVSDYEDYPIEIVRWPAKGWRPVDLDTGDEAGTVSGIFRCWWEGDVLYGENEAVEDEYILGWSKNLKDIDKLNSFDIDHSNVILWHANYHPDGGQLFYPLDDIPFVIPLALPGDDVKPSSFKAFYVERGGVYIHPNVWHEGVFPTTVAAEFYGEQGLVHARISCNIAKEFGVFLNIPLVKPIQK